MDPKVKAIDGVAFSTAQLDKIFPFHVSTDENLMVTHLGPGLSRLTPELRPGDPLPQVFRLVRPSLPFTGEEIRHSVGLLALLESPGGVRMRGQFQTLEGGGLIYLAAPGSTV